MGPEDYAERRIWKLVQRVEELESLASKHHAEIEELHKELVALRNRTVTVNIHGEVSDPKTIRKAVEEAMKTEAPSASRPSVTQSSGSTTSTTKTVTINFNGPPAAEDIHKFFQDTLKSMGL